MKGRLPVYIEDNKLPTVNKNKKNDSYGYISIFYILSLFITVCSVLFILSRGR